jgi:UDP-N-acetylmuramoyl-tripeptide--D-alanyl-D-alanine ligase
MEQNGSWDILAARASAYSSDSRSVGPQQIFVALKGEQRDGHDFVPELLKRGILAAVIQKDQLKELGDGHHHLVRVPDTHQAHRALASAFRRKFTGKVIAVGGSSGKTTTKDFIATLLAERFRVMKTEKSQNGEQGIPKTLERLSREHDVAVIEVGIDGPGDMHRHAHLVAPDVAVLTSIGEEHLNLLKSIENVFNEEKILFDLTWQRGGHCFAPSADSWLAKLKGEARLSFSPPEVRGFKFPFDNPLQLQNAALAIEVARHLGLKDDEIQRGLDKLHVPDGRGGRLQLRKDFVLLTDHYNANPSSMRAGLQYAARLATEEGLPLRLILGDMLDLGEATQSAHDELLNDIFQTCPSEVILVGPSLSRLKDKLLSRVAMVEAYPDSKAARACAQGLLSHSGLILLKGSRGMALEHVLEELRKSSGTPG